MVFAALHSRRGAVTALTACTLSIAASGGVWAQPAFVGHQSGISAHRVLPPANPATLPSQLLFVPTGAEQVNIYDLHQPNKRGPLAQITTGLVGSQFQMTVDGAGDLFVVNDNFVRADQQYVTVYAPPYTGAPTILSGAAFPLGVAVDSAGTVYVTNCGKYCGLTPTIYVYKNGSTTPTGSITSPAFESLGGLALDKAGNLYIASSDRTTGASDVFEVAAGSTNPVPLHLRGLFNIGGPGVGSVAIDANGNLNVENNSNSTYILSFKPGKKTAFRIVDPFSFFDVPGMLDVGPDGNLYVPINCPNQTCEGAVVGFKPTGKTPFEKVGTPGSGISGVATSPNPILQASRTPASYFRKSVLGQTAFPIAPVLMPRPGVTWSHLGAAPALAAQQVFGQRGRSVTAMRGGGWLSPEATGGKNLLYLSTAGNGASFPGAVNIYPAQGQSQAPIGVLTAGISVPQGIATDKRGNLYVANSGNNTVTVYPPGKTNPSSTYTNGVGTPYDVKVGTDGTVYVANVSAPPSGYGTVTEYPRGSKNPSITLSLAGENAVAVALDASNNLYVSWYSGSGIAQVYKYAPGSTSGTNLGLDLPAPSFPLYGLAFDHRGNLVLWYESFDHSIRYLAAFAPGATKPTHVIPGGSFLSNVSGIAFPRSSGEVYLGAINVNEGDKLSYPNGIPLDVIGLNFAVGVALSPGT